jgi:hypothetical protein
MSFAPRKRKAIPMGWARRDGRRRGQVSGMGESQVEFALESIPIRLRRPFLPDSISKSGFNTGQACAVRQSAVPHFPPSRFIPSKPVFEE